MINYCQGIAQSPIVLFDKMITPHIIILIHYTLWGQRVWIQLQLSARIVHEYKKSPTRALFRDHVDGLCVNTEEMTIFVRES